jgi:hypothetical protein
MERDQLERFRRYAQDAIKQPWEADAGNLGDYLLQALDEVDSLRRLIAWLTEEGKRDE